MCEASAVFPGVVHWIQGETVLASRRNRIYQSIDSGNQWTVLLSLPVATVPWVESATRLTRRLFRAGIHHIGRAGENLVIMAFRSIYCYNLKTMRLLEDNIVDIPGSRPLKLCKASESILYFGEYRANKTRKPVNIFGSMDGGLHWQPVYQFESVRHIHGVFYDPYSNAIWVTTGDKDDEAGIFVTENHFRTLERVIGGNQQTRAIQLLFTDDYVYFGSDTPLENNHIYRLSRHSGGVEMLQEVEGSVFHGCKIGDKLFFSTACEPSAVNRSRDVVVWTSNDGVRWRRFLSVRKDRWPMKLFQYGQILFPNGDGPNDTLWLTPFATRGDQASWRFSL